jgi:hypothetical protein
MEGLVQGSELNDMDCDEFIEENSTAMIEEVLMEEYGMGIFEMTDKEGFVGLVGACSAAFREEFEHHGHSE